MYATFGTLFIGHLQQAYYPVPLLVPDNRWEAQLREWLLLQRLKATDGTAIAKAIDYSLGRWGALTRFLDDGALPIDNNWVENRIRPIALGRSVGTLQLAVCRIAARRKACRSRDESDSIGPAQWPRPLPVPQRHSREATYPPGEPYR